MALWHLEGTLDETKTVRKIPVTNFPFVIGRNKSLDMVILRNGISREHAEIFIKSGRLYIRDLGSTNGTFVNKHRISGDTLLTHNTVIHFSEVDFKLIDSEFREPSDELMTVVVNMADVPGLDLKDDRRAANRERSSNANKPAAKQVQDSLSENLGVQEDSGSVSNSAGNGQKSHPRYFANENIFVQEGGDHSNRRSHPRREARWPATVKLRNGQSLQCTTKDFCDTGISLMLPIKIPDQSVVSVDVQTFYKGRNRNFSIEGVVRHSLLAANGFIVGIHITQCSKACSEFIAKYSTHQI